MNAEPLGENTYKITLNKDEVSTIPPTSDRYGMQRFICELIDSFSDDELILPEGKLLAEMFLRSDGSCVFFITALEQDEWEPEPQYYCCDIKGIDALRALCSALSYSEIRCSIYCGSCAEGYRLIFTDPEPDICRICTEYGELSEISRLFVCQTEEYLTEISHYGDIRAFCELLG